jgi:hypothetical protein
MKLCLILFLFVASSCDKRHEISLKNGIFVLKDVKTNIIEAKEVDWKVGKSRDENVSKGIRVKVKFPKLSEESIDRLRKKHKVDSYIFRFSKFDRGRFSELGAFYLRFENISKNTNYISISLFYQSASVSKAFRSFHCPAFKHRFKIVDYELQDRKTLDKEDIYIRLTEYVRGQVSQIRFAPNILPGGLSLEGKYVIDMAFYSTKNKQRFSKWHKVGKTLNIKREKKIAVPSCLGIKEENNPLPESRIPNIRDLEIK